MTCNPLSTLRGGSKPTRQSREVSAIIQLDCFVTNVPRNDEGGCDCLNTGVPRKDEGLCDYLNAMLLAKTCTSLPSLGAELGNPGIPFPPSLRGGSKPTRQSREISAITVLDCFVTNVPRNDEGWFDCLNTAPRNDEGWCDYLNTGVPQKLIIQKSPITVYNHPTSSDFLKFSTSLAKTGSSLIKVSILRTECKTEV